MGCVHARQGLSFSLLSWCASTWAPIRVLGCPVKMSCAACTACVCVVLTLIRVRGSLAQVRMSFCVYVLLLSAPGLGFASANPEAPWLLCTASSGIAACLLAVTRACSCGFCHTSCSRWQAVHRPYYILCKGLSYADSVVECGVSSCGRAHCMPGCSSMRPLPGRQASGARQAGLHTATPG